MNKVGGGFLMALVVAALLFFFGMLVVNFIKPDVSIATSSAGLDCDNINISDGAKVTCLGIDLVVPYFIVLVISVAGGFVASRFL